MTECTPSWLLLRRDEPVAELIVEAWDPPWLRGRVRPGRGWCAAAVMFDEERRLASGMHLDLGAWVEIYLRLRRELRLVAPDGREVARFVLHIDGEHGWWRCCDRTFPVPEITANRHPRSALNPEGDK